MIKSELTISIKGEVTPFSLVNGNETLAIPVHNSVQAEGAQAIVQALSEGSFLSRVYFLYSSSSSPTAIGASSGNLTAQDFLTEGSGASTGLLSCPAFSYGQEFSEGDTATGVFMAISDNSESSHLSGISYSDGVYVYAVGLVLPSPTGDILYAACDFLTPVAKAANSQVGVRWKTQITIG